MYDRNGGLVRSILDICHCSKEGKLLPRSYPFASRESAHGPVLDYLSCTACGLRYDAKEEGKSLFELRQLRHTTSAELEQRPAKCPHCLSDRIATEKAAAHGIISSRDPRRHPDFAFCEDCNSTLGRLPIDLELIAEYERGLEEKARALDRLG